MPSRFFARNSFLKLASAGIYIARIDGRHPVVVELRTDAGVTGLGEAAIAYGVGETAAAGMIKDLRDGTPRSSSIRSRTRSPAIRTA